MRRILMDCDTGGDDATAIALAVASKDIELLGITACMGNLELTETFRNALELVTYLETDVPVAKGAADPLVRERWVSRGGLNRLQIPDLPTETIPPSELDAVEFMAKTLRESDTKITLVPLAPLTNIAKLMMLYPELVKEKVDEIVIMGGGMYCGNTTGAAELNLYADPEAAKCVFNFGVPVVMHGLDVCHKAYILPEESDRAKDLGKCGSVFYYMCERSYKWREEHNMPKQAIMYDSLPIVYLLYPEIFKTVKASIDVETGSELCDGMTVCDARDYASDEEKAGRIHTVVLDLDREAYIEKALQIYAEGN